MRRKRHSGSRSLRAINASNSLAPRVKPTLPRAHSSLSHWLMILSGIEATCRIREAHPETAVILLSTYSEADLPNDAKDCGALAYVHKEDFGPALVRQLWDGWSSARS